MTMQGTDLVSVPEAARRLGLDGVHIYELLLDGRIDGGPSLDGTVRVSLQSIRAYLEAAAAGS